MRGHERGFVVPEHAVHFAAADGEDHVRIARVAAMHRFCVLLIPARHLDEIVSSEGCRPPRECRAIMGGHDPVLRMCMDRLAGEGHAADARGPTGTSTAARRLVLRLAELNGSGRPDWSCDTSTFDRRVLTSLVEYIDGHLRIAPSLGDLATRVGLSQSHFAKKFRQSAGLSVHRFINQRRVNASLELLKAEGSTIAGVALDLGFSNQSHFTRVFGDLTGLTPARYRKQFGPQ